MNAAVDNTILFPPGRIVQGDLYEPQDTDMQGNPLTIKNGQNAGQKRVNFFFALAIPKAGERAWWETSWGQKVLALANGYWPQGQTQNPRFAWKISDGDDTTPNPEANMRRNCDREGFPGNWVVRFGSGFATKVYDAAGNPLLTPGLVKRGFWAEVLGSVNSNEQATKPGIYVNHQMVFYRAPDKEIVSGPDPRSVGAGRAALPQGITPQPLGNAANVPASVPGQPGAVPAVPGAPPAANVPANYAPPAGNYAPPPAAYPAYPGAGTPSAQVPPVPGAPMPGPTPVQPQSAFLQPPGPGAATPPPPAAPGAYTPPPPAAAPSVVCQLGAPMGYKMVNLNGGRYEQFRAGGWTDAAMLQAGHMVRL